MKEIKEKIHNCMIELGFKKINMIVNNKFDGNNVIRNVFYPELGIYYSKTYENWYNDPEFDEDEERIDIFIKAMLNDEKIGGK